jgi:hypothetical protein
MNVITVNAELLAAVSVAQSTDPTRYYLGGVFFDSRGVMVASDGHVLTAAQIEPDADRPPVILPVSPKARTALKGAKAETAEFADGLLRVLDASGQPIYTEPCAAIDGAFPDWRRVIPREPVNPSGASFALEVRQKLNDTAKCLAKNPAISILGAGAESAHVVRYDSRPDLFSVAMPVRHAAPDDGNLPGWMSDEKTPEA